MNKNSKDHEKRRQKKQAEQKASRGARLAAYRAAQARVTASRARLREATKGGVILTPLGDDDYVFWLCHGANYLASDSTTGIWSPVFEDIYQGEQPSPGSVAQKVLATYQKELEAEGAFGGVPRTVLAWTVTDRSIVTVYKHEAVRRLLEKDPGCDAEALARSPHNPTVWALMDKVKQRSLVAGSQIDEETANAGMT